MDLIKLSNQLIDIEAQLDGGFDKSDSDALLLAAGIIRNLEFIAHSEYNRGRHDATDKIGAVANIMLNGHAGSCSSLLSNSYKDELNTGNNNESSVVEEFPKELTNGDVLKSLYPYKEVR